MSHVYVSLLAVTLICAACAPETEVRSNSPLPVSTRNVASPATTMSGGAGAPAMVSTASTAGAPAIPVPSVTPRPPGPEGAAPQPPAPAPPPATPPQPMVAGTNMNKPPPTPAANGGSTPADKFCDKYGEHCGYAMPNRHADRAACLADFNATPVQQGCKTMHLDTAIAGTAAACNGMPSAFCFSIHCLHAAGIMDPTGVTYCK